jgi:type IV pilus assembly protein PilQ
VDTLRHEAESRRAQHDAEALAVDKITFTRFLSYAHAKDLVITCKKFISSRGDVIADERTNAIIVTDVPSVVPAIDKLLTQLDRKTQQVEIEARVVAATRSFARDLGTQLGFGWGNSTTGIGGASAVGTTPTATFGLTPFHPIIGSSAPTSTTGVQIPLFSNLGSTSPTSGINITSASNNVRLDAVLTMAESRGLVKILSRPRVVTQNNIQALVRQGVRVPIVTQAQLGGPPTVTYVDAFLRLTVVPQITSEGTIFLNVDVENTTPDFGQSIQGNPTLITQQATTQVLVTDGGTVVIGGVIQTNNSVQVSQVPLLGNIPYLGNLFKHTQVSTSNQELIFFITPRIIQT